MPQKIIEVPPEGDCFFHVVAYFLGADPRDVQAALTCRRQLATYAASVLFKAPYNDLAALTARVRGSTQVAGLAAIQGADTSVANSLRDLYQQGPALDGGNGGGCAIAVFVVWLQYSFAEIGVLKNGADAQWLRSGGFLTYTLWGDMAFAASLVRRRYGMKVDCYTPANLATLVSNAPNTVNLYFANSHFDIALFKEPDWTAWASSSTPQGGNGKPVAPHIGNLTVEIHHLDVGQGDATLIVVRDQRKIIYAILIDAGDAGQAEFIHAYMKLLGVTTLDILAITHYDKDHFRGAIALLNQSSICQDTRIFDRGDSNVDPDRHTSFGKSLASSQTHVNPLYEDDTGEAMAFLTGPSRKRRMCAGAPENAMVGVVLMQIGTTEEPALITLTCVAANGHVLRGAQVPPLHSDRENGMSLCFLLRFGTFSYFLGGDAPGVPANDLEGAVGKAIMAHWGLDHVCGMKVSHHGSEHSTKPEFVDLLQPTAAFVSCGRHDKMQHPRQEPIDALQACARLQNMYFSSCIYKRQHVTPDGRLQQGKARVAGDETRHGGTVLRIEQSTLASHIFYAGYWDREQNDWRVQRHCCTDARLSSEITPVPEELEEMFIGDCPEQDNPLAGNPELLLEDAIERQRALFDRKMAHMLLCERDARRGVLKGDETRVRPEAKTEETAEMVTRLDQENEEKMDEEEDAAYDADEAYDGDDAD